MSFKVDSVDKEHVTIDRSTLDKHGFDSAAELIQTVMDNIDHVENEDNEDEQIGTRRFDRGYQGGEQ
jgi:hypothetical protein